MIIRPNMDQRLIFAVAALALAGAGVISLALLGGDGAPECPGMEDLGASELAGLGEVSYLGPAEGQSGCSLVFRYAVEDFEECGDFTIYFEPDEEGLMKGLDCEPDTGSGFCQNVCSQMVGGMEEYLSDYAKREPSPAA